MNVLLTLISFRCFSLIHPKSLKHRINRVGVEAGLKLGKQLSRNCWDVCCTAHWQGHFLGPCIKSDLEALSKAFYRCNGTAETHIPQHHHLVLKRLTKEA